MKKVNKKILESKKIIKEEKGKIKLEKKNLRKKKYNKFSNTKVYKFFNKIISFFKVDRDTYSFSEVFIITLISLVVGAFSCFSLFMVFTGGRNYFKHAKELDKFLDVYETIIENYYDDIDKESLIENAINGMVSSVGDEYTSYVDINGTSEFNELVSGVYEGIGCTIQNQDAGITVIDVYENSPASKGGLIPGDIILAVDDKLSSSISIDELSNYIKSTNNSEVVMKVLRDSSEITIKLKRGRVEIPVVNSAIYEKGNKKIGYINISIFSSVATKQFKEHLKSLSSKKIDSLIIDVRNNNGGYLTTVTDILSEILPKGKVMYKVEKDGKTETTKDKTNSSLDLPIAVLVNEYSASASEILAASIKESYGGYVVGVTTYGKGTVQQVKTLSDGSMIKYTVENWLTPDGNWINEVGVSPTNMVLMDSNYYENPSDEYDNQLQKALDLVSK